MSSDDDVPHLPRRSRKNDDPKVIGLWKIGRTIGQGASGRVRIARHGRTGKYAAVKIISKIALVNSRSAAGMSLDEQADRVLLSIEREIVIMKLIDHPNIMRLYDVWETSTELYLILEYLEGGELFEYPERRGRLSTSEALNYFQQVIAAIEYCHKFNIAHRDLKPENLLLDKDGNIKVADFGMATWQKTNANGLLQTACGSPHYAAPEVIRGEGYDGSIADIWSCGVILFALLAGRLPFDDDDIMTLLEKVNAGKFVFPPSMDARAKDLINKMLEMDPTKRITVPEIMKHPFYTTHKPKTIPPVSPRLDEIARPLSSKAAVDLDIFGNLRTLWHGTPDDDIMEKLLNSERTWEKGVYHLLVQYRAKRMEDYDEKAEEIVRRASKRRSKKRASPSDRLNVRDIPPRCDPPTPHRARASDRLARVVEAMSEDDVPHTAARFLAPAGHRPQPERVMALDTDDVRTPASTGFSVATPRGFYSPLPNSVASPSGQSLDPSPLSPNFPLTPVDPLLPAPLVNLDSQAPATPLSPASPIWSALNMSPLPADAPQMQDEKVQHFFKQIMDQFNVMQSVTGNSPAGPMSPQLMLSPPQPGDKFIHTIHTRAATRHGDENESAIRPLSTRRSRPAPLDLHIDKENSSNFIVDRDLDEDAHYEDGGPRPALSEKRIQIIEPSTEDKRKLRRRKTISALDVSSESSKPNSHQGAPPLSPAWFGNLFKLKPAVYALLSIYDADVTREECRRLLSIMGVRAVLHRQGLGILKCKMDESADPRGVMSALKAVRFRVEVQKADSAQAAGGYVTQLQLIQEKGALSTFKLIYGRLKREWTLDAPKIPLLDQGSVMAESRRFEGFITEESR